VWLCAKCTTLLKASTTWELSSAVTIVIKCHTMLLNIGLHESARQATSSKIGQLSTKYLEINLVIFLVISSHFLCKEFLSSMVTHSFSSDAIFFKPWDTLIPTHPTTSYLSLLPHWWFVQFEATFVMNNLCNISGNVIPFPLQRVSIFWYGDTLGYFWCDTFLSGGMLRYLPSQQLFICLGCHIDGLFSLIRMTWVDVITACQDCGMLPCYLVFQLMKKCTSNFFSHSFALNEAPDAI